MIQRIINHFSWTPWESIGQQHDSYRKAQYEVFKKTNKNGLSKYKKVKIVGASCHSQEARIIQVEGAGGKPVEKS